MNKVKCSILLIMVLGLAGVSTCDLPTQPGPMPKKIIDTEFEPGLNVFGVLRADDIPGSSFIHVEKAVTTEEMYEGVDIFITDAWVQLTDSLTGFESVFISSPDTTEEGYYFNSGFNPQPGQHYFLEIISGDFPVLKGETTVPVKPALVPQSLSVTDKTVQFELLLTSDTYQYNIYLFFDGYYLEKQLSNESDGARFIRFDFSNRTEQPTGLVIIGYDRNLSVYLNSSPSFIPQTYHETVRTVENGYGCFGSLAVTLVSLFN
ncbi:DUF4249 domain-containing protein [bacterium]|nr:DUF4249 domain-containing protein [bacterium]